MRRRDVVHPVVGAQRESAFAELAVYHQLVVLVFRVRDAVLGEHTEPPLAAVL